jgi:hypothetical protein
MVKVCTNQQKAKYCAIAGSIIYLIIFPIFSWMALFWNAASDPVYLADFVTNFTWFLVPISIPASIYIMWSRYRIGGFKKVFYAFLLPFVAFGIFLLINAIIRS